MAGAPPGIWQDKGPWKVYVEVLGGRDIPENKNPYVKLKLGETERLTKKVNGSIAPAWMQEYEFDLLNAQQQLQCTVLDPKSFGKDIVLGEIQIPLGMLVDGIERDEWFDLLKARSGKIHLKILANGPNADENRQKSNAPLPSIGLAKKGPKHRYEEKKFKDKKACKVCQGQLGGKLFGKSYECAVCQVAVCQQCFQSFDLKMIHGCRTGNETPKAMTAQMSQSVMNFYLNYTGRDKEGKLIVHSLPQEWKELFKSAGVKPRELKNPDTVIMLLEAMDKHNAALSSGVSSSSIASSSSAPASARSDSDLPVLSKATVLYDYEAAQEGDLTLRVGDMVLIHEKLDNGWWNGTSKGVSGFFPGGYVEEILQEPEAPPPPPPAREEPPPPPVTPKSAPAQAPVHVPAPPSGGPPPPPAGGPPPPPPAGGPPPPPPAGGPPPPPGPPPPSGGGMAAQLAGAKLKPNTAPAAPARPAAGGRDDLLSAIRGGTQLKHTEVSEQKAKPPPAAGGSGALINVLSETINKRREQLSAEGMDEGGDDGDWDDWD
jgi:hypothetical protein